MDELNLYKINVQNIPPGKVSFISDPELERRVTKFELISKLSKYKNEIVEVSYRDKTGRGTSTSPRVLNDFAVEASEQEGVNIITLYLKGFTKPLFLYQSNQEIVLDEGSKLVGKLAAITLLRKFAA